MYASERQNLYFPMQDVVTVSVRPEGGLNTYPFQFWFSSLDLKASTRDIITAFFPYFIHQKSCRAGREVNHSTVQRLSWKHNSDLHKMDGLLTFQEKKREQGIFQVPLSSHHMDSVGIWQMNLVKVALASQSHPSAQTFSPQSGFINCREISWRQHYNNIGVTRSEWICLRVSTYFMTTQCYLKNIFFFALFQKEGIICFIM